ncbi:MAG: hypothetical protein E6J79_09625 [Deltaproteobacteria bacterium]|nr:MAG: hypothetical protein E6J79_09625 [Deltaproteobacteria bacterium]
MARVALLSPLTPDERSTFLVVTLSEKSLAKLVGRLGTAPPGTRVDRLGTWDLAWSLVDYYENDPEVAAAVDRTLRKDIGASPLAAAVASEGGGRAVADLVLESRDPARDLAWALLGSAVEGAGELASALVKTIIAEFDEADAHAREPEEGQPAEPPADSPPPETKLASDAAKQAARAQRARDRTLKRLGGLKERLVELERSVASARRDLRQSEEERTRLETEGDRLREEREGLRARLQSGTAGEVTRLGEELEATKRRARALDAELEEAREAEAMLAARLRAAEAERTARPAESAEERPASSGAGWSLPLFTDEFYESIRRWDRKIVRNAFEKIYRLAEDWRHPSLRAIPLEGLPDHYRIRVATDVRLIYRPLDGGRVEILSLIDREDLQRYIRQAKSR